MIQDKIRFAVCLIAFGACSLDDAMGQQQSAVKNASDASAFRWERLADLPNARGVAGAFAGVIHGRLFVAGGANFPDKMPWQGGKKIWHDDVWMLDKPQGAWTLIGKMPMPLGYGVSISTEDGLLLIGGSNGSGHHATVTRMRFDGGERRRETLPSLPYPLANCSGCMVGRDVYVVGGSQAPDSHLASRELLKLDLSQSPPAWKTLDACPGPGRILPVVASWNDQLFMFSGAELTLGDDGQPKRTYLRDAYRFSEREGWKQLADAPLAFVAAPMPAFVTEQSEIVILGGDDGKHVGFQPPEAHPGFSKSVWRYDLDRDTWHQVGDSPMSQVTAPLVEWNASWILISGEVRPGVRTPAVWKIDAR